MSVQPSQDAFSVRVQDENLPRTEVVEILLKLSSAQLTARDLISERVRAECDRLLVDIKGALAPFLIRPTDEEIALNGDPRERKIPMNPENRVKTALEAFESNGFILLVDDIQIESLDQEIKMTPTSVVTFLKLTPLVGG
ncbi:MAG: hypothetical protein HKN27_14930 [Silicimonas sp.]|nr:hypothetical protein [Silicimonas sp.]